MKLRELETKDANMMLEWMHDEGVVKHFRFNSINMTLDDVLNFIETSHNLLNDKHFAIVDDNDEYLGTISLKDIDAESRKAEYAICIRKVAMGKNVAKEATDMILSYAFDVLELQKVYLNVLTENIRAIKFYDKYGFIYEGELKKHLMHKGELKDIKYYAIFKPR